MYIPDNSVIECYCTNLPAEIYIFAFVLAKKPETIT